ncbi:CPBP family intramembrane glutamic endopeptidase [Plantibacter sp. Mn2098]|uniref:CPBP family intramembrane glutamic endopeptidase n=1 Tax=Plantibacter sp. Mn2098 TaxID=3395266 RepID=UPI003BBB2A12
MSRTVTTPIRVPQRFWVGLAAAAVYVAGAAGVANLLTGAFPQSDPLADLALGHFPVLIPLIVAGVLFVRWAGWRDQVWRAPAAFETTPRRWWLLAIPVLLLAQSVTVLVTMPADRWQLGVILLVGAVTALVGFGEELFFRGILRASIRAHHGETVTLIATSLLFGAGHSIGSLMNGVPPGVIAFQVGVTALDGAVLYGAFLATGRLWVPIVLHALDDFVLRVGGGVQSGPSSDVSLGPVSIAIEWTLWVLAIALLVSCIRRDVLARRAAHSAERTTSGS